MLTAPGDVRSRGSRGLVDPVDADKRDLAVAGSRSGKIFVKAGSRVAGQDRVAGVVACAGEQVASPGQAPQLAVSHDFAPLGLTQGEDPSRLTRLRHGEYDDIDLDLGAACWVVHHTVADLSGRLSEERA